MTDIPPDNRNRLAYFLGRVFHPYIVCIPTLFAVLSELPLADAARWSVLVLAILLTPAMSLVVLMQRRGRHVYERRTRGPLYLTGWLSVLLCLVVLILLEAPRVLIACLIALVVWIPLQLTINTYVTKVSSHAAVLAGCAMGLLLLGKLDSIGLQLAVLAIVLATSWSRIATRNHTLSQVVLGLVVGCLPVLVIFPLFLRGVVGN